jgi:diguanylate cyclase (GGDEF)-like protein
MKTFLRHRCSLRQLPLQWVLVIPCVLQTLGIVGLVGYLSYTSGQRSIQKLAYQLMENVDQQVSHELSSYLHSAHGFNQRQMAAVQAGVINPQDLEQLHRYLMLQHRQAEELTTLLFGTPQGDACLQQVAKILQRHINRPGDLVSRYGGEEFLLILPQTNRPGAIHLVETIRQSLAQARLPHTASLTVQHVTVSMGVAVIMDVASFGSPTAAIVTTDKLLYQAKQTRNTYCLRVI